MKTHVLRTVAAAGVLGLAGAAHAQGAVSTGQFSVGEPAPPRMVPQSEAEQMRGQPAPPPAMPHTNQPPPAAQPQPGYTPAPATGTETRPQPKAWQASSGGLPPVQEVSGVRYVTGGFGQPESTALRAAISEYPVAFVLSRVSGEYVAYVPVEITGAGSAPSVTIKADGPYLLVDLPRGSYTARATYEGRTLTRQFTVGSGRGQRIGFAW